MRARQHHPQQFWQDHIDAWRAGEMTQSAYCSAAGLNHPSFSRWKTKLAREAAGVGIAEPTFVPLQLLDENADYSSSPRSGLTLHCGSVRVEVAMGFDPATLRALLAVLE